MLRPTGYTIGPRSQRACRYTDRPQAMQNPRNLFKQSLLARQAQIGLWLGLANPLSAEICALAGFDWLLIDGEHAPNTLPSILAQSQSIAGVPGNQVLARLPVGDPVLVKQYLDLGVQTLLIPMVESAAQAHAMVQAARYPQADGQGGVRGMAGARASRWGHIANYAQEANGQVCVLVQVETALGLEHLDAICATPGVDGVFIGPADLSASLGFPGQTEHPQVLAQIEDAIARILRAGKAPGILTTNEALARRYLELGVLFICVGLDTNLLMQHTRGLAARFKGQTAPHKPSGMGY